MAKQSPEELVETIPARVERQLSQLLGCFLLSALEVRGSAGIHLCKPLQ